MNVVTFHGSGGNGMHDKVVQQVKEITGINLIAPTIDYFYFQQNMYLYDLLKEMVKAERPDVLMGYSMGGYWAYYLGKALDIPIILFNPAISKLTMSYNIFGAGTKFEECVHTPHLRAYIGNNDKVVQHDETIATLNAGGYNNDNIIHVEGGHNDITFKEQIQYLLKLKKETV